MKDVVGYEGLYAVTSCGKVWSYCSKKFLKPQNNQGYLQVLLHKNGKLKAFLVHRLVAQAYIPNPDNLPEVNHKDEVKSHNWINNLEWCDHKYNSNYGTRNEKTAKKNGKKIRCIETGQVFVSIGECGRQMGLWAQNICGVAKGRQKHAGGYTFAYVKEEN